MEELIDEIEAELELELKDIDCSDKPNIVYHNKIPMASRNEVSPLRLFVALVLSLFVIIMLFTAPQSPSDGGQDTNIPADNPPPTNPKLRIGLTNDASTEVHVWIYLDGREEVNTYLGTGFLDDTNVFYLDGIQNAEITVKNSLSYITYSIPGTWSDGDYVSIQVHQDGTFTYFEN